MNSLVYMLLAVSSMVRVAGSSSSIAVEHNTFPTKVASTATTTASTNDTAAMPHMPEQPWHRPRRASATATADDAVVTTTVVADQTSGSYYYSTSDAAVLGYPRRKAAIGNPLKGLMTSPRWLNPNNPPEYTVSSSLEFYYIGLNEIVTDYKTYNWTVLDATLRDAASRSNHVIWRIYCHYPGWTLAVPEYLISAGIELVDIGDDETSPHYDDPILLQALQQFIAAFGRRYDGHKSVAFIQLGLLGYWGEWHTYPVEDLISDETMDKIVRWYSAAFEKTKLQCRTPLASVFANSMGIHDDSFAYSSLGSVSWFTMPQLERAGQTEFWRYGGVSGGEVRPEIQDDVLRRDFYPEEYKQDLLTCVFELHTTYLLFHRVFNGDLTESELSYARRAHARMGYSFIVSSIGASQSKTPGRVNIDVTVMQTGAAPFYYPLSLAFRCPGTIKLQSGVETLLEKWDTKRFSFRNIPASAVCLQNVNITLESEYAYPGKPIKFAQGKTGLVQLTLPLPGDGDSTALVSSFAATAPTPSSIETSELFHWSMNVHLDDREPFKAGRLGD